jgi:hypothetical protein
MLQYLNDFDLDKAKLELYTKPAATVLQTNTIEFPGDQSLVKNVVTCSLEKKNWEQKSLKMFYFTPNVANGNMV